MSDASTIVAEYLLGLLEPDERDAVARRVIESPDFHRDLLWWSDRLAPMLQPNAVIAPPSAVWTAISARINEGQAITARRRSEGVWIDLGAGSQIRMLTVNPHTGERTALVRMQPGSVFPAHEHDQIEECFIIEGSIDVEGRPMSPAIIRWAGQASRTPQFPRRPEAFCCCTGTDCRPDCDQPDQKRRDHQSSGAGSRVGANLPKGATGKTPCSRSTSPI